MMRSRLVKSLCVGVHQTVEKEEVSAGRHLHQDQDNDQNDWMDYAVVCRYANPNRVFEPTIIWGKGNLGALGSAVASLLLGEQTKVAPPFFPSWAQKTAIDGKTRSNACGTAISLF